jgi:hypothetical protein
MAEITPMVSDSENEGGNASLDSKKRSSKRSSPVKMKASPTPELVQEPIQRGKMAMAMLAVMGGKRSTRSRRF